MDKKITYPHAYLHDVELSNNILLWPTKRFISECIAPNATCKHILRVMALLSVARMILDPRSRHELLKKRTITDELGRETTLP